VNSPLQYANFPKHILYTSIFNKKNNFSGKVFGEELLVENFSSELGEA